MSCQQVSRFISTNNSSTTNNNAQTNINCKNLNNNSQNQNIIKGNCTARGVIQQEDPYVFTESVPTTSPILFNTQKTRTRLNDLTSGTSVGKLQQKKLPLIATIGKITPNLNQLKRQSSILSPIAASNICTTPTAKNILTQTLTATTTTITNKICNNKKLTNVCIVRPQLQQQQQQQKIHHQNYIITTNCNDGDLKSISPPPLYTPPTPSLWQTPLLLESITSTSGVTPSKVTVANVLASKPPTTTTTSQTTPVMGCVTPTVQTVGSTTTIMNPSLTTTAMAKVAPIIVHAPTAPPTPPSSAQSPSQCLPPSNFHNNTLAQHLQKVECLKTKNPTEVETILCNKNVNSTISPLKPSSPSTLPTATSVKTVDNAVSPVKHSENEDLNEIPVNVIFRMAVIPQMNEKSSNNMQFAKPQTEIDTQSPPTPLSTQTVPPSSPPTIQIKTNVNQKLSTPASKQLTKQQQITTSSIPLQQLSATKTTTATALNSKQHQTPNESDDTESKITKNCEISMKLIGDDSNTIPTDPKKKNSTHTSGKTQKLNLFPSTKVNFDLPHNWQMFCSPTKGAVAIVKKSQYHIDLDTTHLATPNGLPYCLQQHWFNSYNLCKSSETKSLRSFANRTFAREERIAEYKQQLRKQAVQLLSIRTLQKLPLKLAKRRLLCVDRLLRKYQKNEQNNKVLPAHVKQCCVNGCDAYTLEMATHCQQHIVYNAAQHVFLPCTAKFADNTQCRVPVFDITHDLPLCMEHARKRDAYNRLLYEQRPRKMSTNSIVLNDSMILTPRSSTTNANIGFNVKGITIEAHNNQQQQHQHVLQQLPLSSNINGNKRPALITQQARKRKIAAGLRTNPVGRPQKRVKKTPTEKSVGISKTTTMENHQMPRLTSTSLKRKNSTTSLESIASNSQQSTASNTSQQTQKYQLQQLQPHLCSSTPTIANNTTASSLAPPALAPLSSGFVGNGLPQHLFSYGHDLYQNQTQNHPQQQRPQLHPININKKHSSFVTTTNSTATASTPTELKDFISQFSLISQKQTQADTTATDVNLLNNNSNSNFTSSGMGSTTSLLTADDFLTQDMLSICENSSASSADTGLGGLSDPELMLGGPEDDLPLADTRLLEEHDLENVLNSLPEDAFKELFTTVHQDESDEIERAIELADKHLKTLQQTICSELGDFLDFNDDMLMDNVDLCNGSAANVMLDTSALFMGCESGGSPTAGITTNATQGGRAAMGTDIRGLVQT